MYLGMFSLFDMCFFPFGESKNFSSTIVTHFVVGDSCKKLVTYIPERSDTSEYIKEYYKGSVSL